MHRQRPLRRHRPHQQREGAHAGTRQADMDHMCALGHEAHKSARISSYATSFCALTGITAIAIYMFRYFMIPLLTSLVVTICIFVVNEYRGFPYGGLWPPHHRLALDLHEYTLWRYISTFCVVAIVCYVYICAICFQIFKMYMVDFGGNGFKM